MPNPGDKLRISMTAQVSIILAESAKALTIPSVALGEKGPDGRYLVRVLDKQGLPQTRHVRIGLNNKVSAQVLDGLAEGEKVVLGEATENTPTSTQRMGPPPM